MKSLFQKSCLLGFACLAACTVGPDYERPDIETPATYKETSIWSPARPMDDTDRGTWWHVYNDPVLDGLEKQIDVSNQNLKAAEAAYREANAIVDETRATLFPSLALNGSATRSGEPQPGIRAQNTVAASANASWTPDVWGSIRRSLESDVANAQASAADLASARLSAQGTLATTYFELRIQDELKRILKDVVEADRQILKIVENQYNSGVAARSDVLTAEAQLETAKAAAVNADINRMQYEHAIAVLIGKPPAEFHLTETKLSYHVPRIPVDVPSTLLERRPDIATAEREVAAANAEIGVAIAAWYPNFTLSASYGTTGTAFSKLLQASNSLWSVGPSVAETIFDAGAREARVEEAKAAYDQSVANYRQTVLSAFQEVEDNLSSLKVLSHQAAIETAALIAARKNEKVSLNQYKEGIVAYSSVLTAETTRLADEEATLTVYGNRLTSSVALIQSLGGGWNASQMTAPPPSTD